MKTHFSDIEYANKMAQKMHRLATCTPPAILFEKDEKKKSDKESDEKDKYKTFEVKFNNAKNSNKVEVAMKVLENGTPEDFCKWFEQYQELKTMMSLDTASKQVKVIRSVLKDSYLETYNTALMNEEAKLRIRQAEEAKQTKETKRKKAAQTAEKAKDPKAPAEEEQVQVVEQPTTEKVTGITPKEVQLALKAVTLYAFNGDNHAYRRQVRYMRYQMYFTTSNFKPFVLRLKQMNKYLQFFPVPPKKTTVTPLQEEDLIEIIDNAKPIEYNQLMLQNGYDPYDKTLEQFTTHMDHLELSLKFTKTLKYQLSEKTSKSKKKRKEMSKEKEHKITSKLHKCKYCKKMVMHDDDDCWFNPANQKKKTRYHKHDSSSSKKKEPMFTGQQLNFLIDNAHLAAKANKKTKKTVKKRQIVYKHSSESESDHNEEGHVIEKISNVIDSDELTSSSEESENYFAINRFNTRPSKKKKQGHLTTNRVKSNGMTSRFR